MKSNSNNTNPNPHPNHLIIGQGDIGLPVANALAQQGTPVTGLARGERTNYALNNNANFMQADALTLTAEQLHAFTHITIIVTPDSYDADNYKNTYLGIAKHIADLASDLSNLKRIVFISSTGVYGQDNGEWIDETIKPATPKRAGSQYILQAEQALQNAYKDKTIIIRPSGIYGKDRLMRVRKAFEMGKDPKTASMPESSKYAWTNRIMDSDLVNIIVQVLTCEDKTKLKPIYIATDYYPVTSFELMTWLCEKLGTPKPILEKPELEQTEVESSNSSPHTGKRLHSNIPRAWLAYPDWHVGYEMVLMHYDKTGVDKD